jgi:hypothetical protein
LVGMTFVGTGSGEEGAARLVGVAPSAGDGGGMVDATTGVANGVGRGEVDSRSLIVLM